MLNPLWLNTFTTLIEQQSFTLTAQQLYMTQPGVSQHIKKLEAACGCPLIKRINKRFEITPAGEKIYQYAKALVEHEREVLETLEEDDAYSGDCSVATSGALALRLYPQLLALQQQYPKIRIHMEAAPKDKILNQIAQNNVGLGLVTQQPDEQYFEIRAIGQEALCLVLPIDTEISTDIAMSLKSLGLINHPDAQMYVRRYFAQSGNEDLAELTVADIPIKGYVNQLSQILLPVSLGLGFTVLPLSAVQSFHDISQLQILQGEVAVEDALFLVHRKNKSLPARYQMLSQYIEQVLADDVTIIR